MIISAPGRLDDRSFIPFSAQLNIALLHPVVHIDFTSLSWAHPFGTLAIANLLRDFGDHRSALGLPTFYQGMDPKNETCSYLAHFGFFSYIGIPYGNTTGNAQSGERFLPIRVIHRRDLADIGQSLKIYRKLEELSYQLATVLFPSPQDAPAHSVFKFGFMELIRNSFEHGRVDQCTVMAQRYKNGIGEVAISDMGIGVHESLKLKFPGNTPEQNLVHCLRPGISARLEPENDDKWQNTGYGLFITSQIAQRFGAFAIQSAKNVLYARQESSEISPINCKGTVVKFRLSTTRCDDWDHEFRSIVALGERQALKIPGAIVTSKKTMSRTMDG